MASAPLLDREFLEIRAKILELGASFDRLGRGAAVTKGGALLQGWPADSTGAITSTAAAAITTLTVPATDPNDPAGLLRSFAIGNDGKLNAFDADGCGQRWPTPRPKRSNALR